MSHDTHAQLADPLVDEVRAVRKAISERVGDDFDKLGEYLRQVGDEYRSRSGRFRAQPSRPTAAQRE